MSEVEKSLGKLAEEINAEHRAFVGTFRKTVEHGIRAGELLVAAKEQCRHGTWLPWLEESFEGAPRTAQEYMRLYNHRDEILAKTRDSAHLSMSGALSSLSTPKPSAAEVEKQVVVEAVAEANEVTLETARSEYRHDVLNVREAVEREQERREEKGQAFDAGEHARKVAEQKKRSREAEARYRRERRERHTEMFLEVDALLAKAHRAAKEALDVGKDVAFDEEERELLRRQGEAARGALSLVIAAITDDSGTDWDAELAKLEERRQWGE